MPPVFKQYQILVMTLGLISLQGCSTLSHLDQLLTLKALSANGDYQNEYVQEQNQRYQSLLKELDENFQQRYSSQQKVQEAFGAPAFVKNITRDGQEITKWMYTHGHRSVGKDKVYLYFDQNGQLMKFEHEMPKEETAGKEDSV